jgi:hypothetical protein
MYSWSRTTRPSNCGSCVSAGRWQTRPSSAGLAAGDRVVDGQLRLGNGMRVNVQRAENPAAPKAQPVPVAERTP